MHKFHSLNVVIGFPPMSEVFFSTDLCRHHTFCGGVSRVVRAMAEKTRSRSPVRVPDEAAMSEAPKVLPEALEPKGADEEDKFSKGRTGGFPKTDGVPEASLVEVNQETPEESTGRVIVNTMLSAAKSLEACVGKLEANTALLENVQSDSQSLQSLVAGVNYYASTTKASQAAQTAQHKQVAWDWLSSPTDKSPLKDTLKSIAYQSQCTSKAAYKMVETASNILEELKSHKTVMAEQCTLMKTIASNQVEVSKLLKAAIGEEKSDVPPSAWGPCSSWCASWKYHASLSTWISSASYYFWEHSACAILVPPGPPPASSVIQAKFWRFQPVVAPSYEPNESRNPPSAAYSQQEVPSKNPGYLEAVDESGNKRAVSPTGRDQSQTDSLNASFAPRGWMLVPQSGKVHRLYA